MDPSMRKIKVNYLLLENVVGALSMRICRKISIKNKLSIWFPFIDNAILL